jgi:hypothetical protein
MQFTNGSIVVYNNENAYNLNIDKLLTMFKCEKTNTYSDITEYTVLDDIYIDSLNSNFKLEYNKINKIFERDAISTLNYININDEVQYMSNLLCFNNKHKKIYSQKSDEIENKFIISNNSPLVYKHVNFINNIHLNRDFGYLIGYWLLRGGFFKVDGNEYPSWSGRENDILKLKSVLKDQTSLTKSFKEKLQLLLLIEDTYLNFFKTNFIITNKHSQKYIQNWVLLAKQEFIQGLFYGLIASNSYISNDVKGNVYLAIKITNSNIIKELHNIFKFRFGIYSRIIGANNHLSFKFNKKLYEFILFGIEKKYIEIENFDSIVPIINKEILYNSFKIIPWYKFKKNTNNDVEPPTKSYSLTLSHNSTYMLSNGLFTNC